MEFDRQAADNGILSPGIYLNGQPEPDVGTNGVYKDNKNMEEGSTDSMDESTDIKQKGGTISASNAFARDRSNTLPSKVPRMALQVSDVNTSRRLTSIDTLDAKRNLRQEVLKLSPAQITELTSDSGSLPVRAGSPVPSAESQSMKQETAIVEDNSGVTVSVAPPPSGNNENDEPHREVESSKDSVHPLVNVLEQRPNLKAVSSRPKPSPRSLSSPSSDRPPRIPEPKDLTTPLSSRRSTLNPTSHESADRGDVRKSTLVTPLASPISTSMPIPPFSMPTHLQLELSSDRPSQLYIQSSPMSAFPYESSKVKFERLLNFLRLPPQLERVLWFGALTCLDAWLYTFTILPLRFMKALWMLIQWAVSNILRELKDLASYVYRGLGRIWRRYRQDEPLSTPVRTPLTPEDHQDPFTRSIPSDVHAANGSAGSGENVTKTKKPKHRRVRSVPSTLQPNHKADLLQGCLIIISCLILMRFDASRMYHGIRGQAAIKLYVIYNVIEVFDRLLSALGQDILECLFSQETLERKPNGRSKIIRPTGMFLLALIYTVLHATALFYQVITLNVAVNSYSDALLTLLMSNQFVEIKGTVFKKFEKENLFQLTCADVVERFQLWLMLLIIALRNIVELGGLSISLGSSFTEPSSSGPTPPTNASSGTAFGILPKSFTFIPSQLPFQVLGPFVMVLGSEMAVDWIKHAYIAKFNATTPAVYSRYFDILAKDYYSNAFAEQNLTRRLGLPVIPLACLFIRATLQTYHMFLATNVHTPIISTATSLSVESEAVESPVFAQLDRIFRQALGRSSFGGGGPSSDFVWTLDDAIALATMLFFFLALYLLLLAFKLVLGMVLLSIARDRYKGMKSREEQRTVETESKRVGGWGTVEVGEDKRKIIYDGDDEGLRRLRERDARAKEKEKSSGSRGLESVDRYTMVAKRIW